MAGSCSSHHQWRCPRCLRCPAAVGCACCQSPPRTKRHGRPRKAGWKPRGGRRRRAPPPPPPGSSRQVGAWRLWRACRAGCGCPRAAAACRGGARGRCAWWRRAWRLGLCPSSAGRGRYAAQRLTGRLGEPAAAANSAPLRRRPTLALQGKQRDLGLCAAARSHRCWLPSLLMACTAASPQCHHPGHRQPSFESTHACPVTARAGCQAPKNNCGDEN